MPSIRYNERKPLFDELFAGGIDAYVHPTGVIGVKVVTGVAEQSLDPYFVSASGQRGKNDGDLSIFLADCVETARAEVIPESPAGKYPPNTWCLQYKYSGNILDISRIPDENFKAEFLSASGVFKHEFSQDARYYLTERGMIEKIDSIGWPSVAGQKLGLGGYVYNWTSGVATSFEYLGKERLDRDI
jgi:hypothetical protein